MSKWYRITASVALCLGGTIAFAQEAPSEGGETQQEVRADRTFEPDRVIARVGDLRITAKEYQRDLTMRWLAEAGPAARSSAPDAEFRARVMREMVDARILRILSENSGIEVSEDEVRAEYDKGRKRLPSDEAFKAYLDRLGLTPERLMNDLRARIRMDKWTRQLMEGTEVTEGEIAERYAKLEEAGQTKRNAPTADVQQILIMPEVDTEEGWEQARARAEAARQRVLDGETFDAVAEDVSQDPVSAPRGGRYDEAVPGLVGPELSQQMMAMEIGELSDPFRSGVGWHIIRVNARHDPGKRTLEEMSDEIRTVLEHEKKMNLLAERVAEGRRIIRVELTPED
ncbi:MAG: hypothetical protein RLZZ303_2484 [Candidatus Hydrogenedentota bacterium]